MEPAPAQEQAHTQVAGEAGAAARLVAHMWMMVALEVAELAARGRWRFLRLSGQP